MSYKKRLSFLIVCDSTIVLTAIFLSQFLLDTQKLFSPFIIYTSIALLLSHHIFAHIFKLYKKAWSYASIGELHSIFKAVTLTIIVTATCQFIFFNDIYFRALAITWMLHMLLIGGSRFAWRVYRDDILKKPESKNKTLIVGAGYAGTAVVRQLQQNPNGELQPVAFIDDDVRKQGLEIMGVPVVGGVKRIEDVVKKRDINHILIATPSLNKQEINRIFQECSKTKVDTKILPSIEDMVSGKVSISEFRDVQVEDLLGRKPVKLDITSISKEIEGETVVVTGAGGSIGSELCRQICQFNPKQVVLLGHGENSIYSIELELKKRYDHIEFPAEIADIQDRERIFDVMYKYQPTYVFHAAAHKHVPLMEHNPREAVKNNIFGTKNVAEAADAANVQTFVLVSSDKAVNPTNIMGSTKRLAEMVIQELSRNSKTRFVAVRFGNVLGSRGSVVPLFKKQIQQGGPVTVTHPDMTRYFMTIPEASRLVIQAGALARGGEIFVLDMGEPVKIVDLARNLIRLSGYTEQEIPIKFNGIRPGEKMFEELLNENEVNPKQVFPKIYIGKVTTSHEETLDDFMNRFETIDDISLRQLLLNIANNRYEKMPIVKEHLTVVSK
ncbi:polysaccharide biosynthesis protein [Bacillus solimangrovi]|uniref:Polysaccharide biosynthesis protein CapD-like domain-containing protein n=1 Tax=Bacillus solimangrovi TaxID=1305675 RepID=A0A1E5LDG4_9BACI|nr:nucleoside-diphosphate sugar epimerase/dehydratase [Bacillus solimangrovi]OEH92137.1 hypothetical protein BFG57_02365 [Bacillus solimangrovi]